MGKGTPSLQPSRRGGVYLLALLLLSVVCPSMSVATGRGHGIVDASLRTTMCSFCFDGLQPQPFAVTAHQVSGLSGGTFHMDLPGLPYGKRWSCQLLNHFANRMLANSSMCSALQIAAYQHCGCPQPPHAEITVRTICPDKTVPVDLNTLVQQTTTPAQVNRKSDGITTRATTCGDVLVRQNWISAKSDDDSAFFLESIAAPACGCEPLDIHGASVVEAAAGNLNASPSNFCSRAKEPEFVVRSSLMAHYTLPAAHPSLDVTCGDLAKIARFVSSSSATWLPSLRTCQTAFDAHCACADDSDKSASNNDFSASTGGTLGVPETTKAECRLCSGALLATTTTTFEVTWPTAAADADGGAISATITSCIELSEWLEEVNKEAVQAEEACQTLKRAAEEHCGCQDVVVETEQSSSSGAASDNLFLGNSKEREGKDASVSALGIPSCSFCPAAESNDFLSERHASIVVRDSTSGEGVNVTCLELSVLAQYVEDSDKCALLQSIARTSCGCPKPEGEGSNKVANLAPSVEDKRQQQSDISNAPATTVMEDVCGLCSDGSVPFDVRHDSPHSQLFVAHDRRRNIYLTCTELNSVAAASFRRDTKECRALQANAVAFCGCPSPQTSSRTGKTTETTTPCSLCPNSGDGHSVPLPNRRLSPYYTCGEFAALMSTEESPDMCRVHQATAGVTCGCAKEKKKNKTSRQESGDGNKIDTTTGPCRLCGQGRLLPHPARLVGDPELEFASHGARTPKASCYAKELEANLPNMSRQCPSYQLKYQEACCFDILDTDSNDRSTASPATTTHATTNIFFPEDGTGEAALATPQSDLPTPVPVPVPFAEVAEPQEEKHRYVRSKVGREVSLAFVLLGISLGLAIKPFLLLSRHYRRRRRRPERGSVLRPLTPSADQLLVTSEEGGTRMLC